MQNGLLRHLGYFVLFMVIQITIMNNINFWGYINPYIYVMFILLLPFDIKGWALLILAFGTGLLVDMFSDTQGMHAAACVLMAFARPAVINMITSRTDFDPGSIPQISLLGTRWVIIYSLTLILLHHTLLFFLEIFRFSDFFLTIGRILASSGFTFIMVMLGFFFLDNPGKK